MSERRGFSLIEVMVALGIAAGLSTMILGVLLNAIETANRTRLRSELAHGGNVLAHMLRQDLRNAGLGVTTGTNVSTGADALYGAVLVAAETEVGILGDLPRPDSNFATFGLLDDRPATSDFNRHVTWHTENNGACSPSTAVGGCSTADSSQLFPGEASELCNTVGGAEAPHRTCPWGLRRLRGGEPFQVVAGTRQWFSATNNPTLTVHDHGTNNILVVDTGSTFPASWPNDASGALPAGGAGQGFVTTLDRVFYRYVPASRRVERIQCWGVPDASSGSWPAATATAVPSNPCASPFQGMAQYEPVAQNVESVAFKYYDASGNVLGFPLDTAAKKNQVRRVDFHIVLEKSSNGQIVRHEISGGVALTLIQ